jgi:RNA polymerase sigma-70 factor (ECF subfamily)
MASDKQHDFETVALPHLDAVYRMARQLAGNASDAEDLVQETFLRAYRAFGRFELREYGAKPWLLRILHNTFYSHVGREVRQPSLLEQGVVDEFPAEPAPDDGDLSAADVNWDEFDEELKEAVQSLSPEYREVLLLWALEELSYKEIAQVCGCAIGTVMSRLYRARRQVGRQLEEYARRQRIPTERFEK